MNRTRISFFGRRNAGKSSLANAFLSQNLSVVSDIMGTTTDPVSKNMELIPVGPVTITDTAGIDDDGILGDKRIEKTEEILRRTDIAILVTERDKWTVHEERLAEKFRKNSVPFIIARNKFDSEEECSVQEDNGTVRVSAKFGFGINGLKEKTAELCGKSITQKTIFRGEVKAGETVILVCPIDESAPKDRLILPQQMVLRELLDIGAIPMVTKETELEAALSKLREPPALAITDSQVFKTVDRILPKDIPLTSFSILMARYKGYLETALAGLKAIERLEDGDTILLAEGCTHRRQCKDIGTVKIPGWLEEFSGKKLEFVTSSGNGFPASLEGIKLVVHCGGCMIQEKEVLHRMNLAAEKGVPFTNYGLLIAKTSGILSRIGIS